MSPFDHVKPTEETVARLMEMRAAHETVRQEILKTPESRERSLALTKLEESCMWAIKGLVFNQEKA